MKISISNKKEALEVYTNGIKLGYEMYNEKKGDPEAKIIFMEEDGIITSLRNFPEELFDDKEMIKVFTETIDSFPEVSVEDFLKKK